MKFFFDDYGCLRCRKTNGIYGSNGLVQKLYAGGETEAVLCNHEAMDGGESRQSASNVQESRGRTTIAQGFDSEITAFRNVICGLVILVLRTDNDGVPVFGGVQPTPHTVEIASLLGALDGRRRRSDPREEGVGLDNSDDPKRRLQPVRPHTGCKSGLQSPRSQSYYTSMVR